MYRLPSHDTQVHSFWSFSFRFIFFPMTFDDLGDLATWEVRYDVRIGSHRNRKLKLQRLLCNTEI